MASAIEIKGQDVKDWLRGKGLDYAELAVILGLAGDTVRAWMTKPERRIPREWARLLSSGQDHTTEIRMRFDLPASAARLPSRRGEWEDVE